MGQQAADRVDAPTTAPGVSKPVSIENPVINSPFREPTRHFRVVDGQVTGELDDGRRPSQFFVPVAAPKKKNPRECADITHLIGSDFND